MQKNKLTLWQLLIIRSGYLLTVNLLAFGILNSIGISLPVISKSIPNYNKSVTEKRPVDKTKQAEAKSYLNAINRAQTVYRSEYSQFSNSINQLALGLPEQTKYYQYKIVKATSNYAYTTATAKEVTLKSYSGIVFALSDKFFFTVCQTNKPSNKPPSMPKLVGQKIYCPAGSFKLEW